jgi:predicted  nucleic acid-binding Zn-ribbon protein
LARATMPERLPRDSLCSISGGCPSVCPCRPWMAVMSEEIARCPHCGAIEGGASAALDALYREVARLSQLAQEAASREADLRREVRLLRETVARLRGGIGGLRRIVMLPGLDILFS